ncbi:unnamed protein product, partial [Pocillopora meandrina]
KYRSVKKPQETIADRLAEHVSEESQTKNQVIGDEAKVNFLKCAEQFVNYQKSFATEKPLFKHEVFEAMAVAVTKMTDVLSSQRYASHKLEKFLAQLGSTNCQYGMNKYKQDKNERLQRFRKILP